MRYIKKWIAGALCLSVLLSQGAMGALAVKEEPVITTDAHVELAREAAAEGMVLLENEGALPLPERESVALFGSGQINFQKGGGGSGDVNTTHVYNLLEGMQEKEAQGKISLYEPLVTAYSDYIAQGGQGEMPLDSAMVNDAAKECHTAVVVISRYSQEGVDRNSGKGDFLLSDQETDMLQKIYDARFRKVVVVLNIGGVMDTTWFDNYDVNAVLLAWQPGMSGALAAADILCGDVNPSGKLTDTFAKSYADYPSSATFSESGHNDYINHTDDIFVGYRYFETIPGAAEKVVYPFGYGLSYTTFSLSEPQVSEKDGVITASVQVTNTGDMAGKEVVQAYFSAPQRDNAEVFLDKAAYELAAFQKTGLLQPGESETVTLSYNVSDMSSYDDVGKTGKKSAYVLEPGDYDLYIGNSVRDAQKRGACFTYEQAALEVTEQYTETLVPYRLEERMRADGTYEELPYEIVHTVSAEGATTIEAEDYTWGSRDVRIEKVETSTEKGRCLAGLSGNSVEFKLQVEEAGDYRVQLRMSNGLGNIADMLHIYLNDELQPDITIDMPSTGSGEWYNFTTLAPFTVTLPEGACTLKLEAPGDCGNLDSLTIEQAVEGEHYVSAMGSTKIEMEDYAELDERARVEEFSTVDGSGACLADLSNEGAFVSYNLRVAEAGDYRVVLRAANGWGNEIQDMLDVYVDNTLQPDISVDLPPTGTGENPWHHYVDLDAFTITLPAGACTLEFVSTGTCGNLDSLTLERVDPNEQAVSADGSTKIEAEAYSQLDSRGGTEDFSTVDGSGTCVSNMSDSGTYVSYKLRTEAAGEYRVTLHAASGWGDIPDMLEVYVDDVIQPGIVIHMPNTSTPENQWFHFIDLEAFTVTLPEGGCTLKFVSKGECGNLDYFTIEPAEDDAEDTGEGIAVSADGDTKIEMENYAELDERGGTEDFSTVDGSGTCVSNMSAAGTYVSYNLQVAEAGTYQVILRAANGWGEIQDMLDVYVDDTLQPGISITMPSTGTGDNQWHHYVDLEAFTITLPEGGCTLKFVSKGECGNLDFFTLRRAETQNTAFIRTAAAAPAAAAADSGTIYLLDVYNDPSLMDDFLAQMSLEDLADLSSGQHSDLRWQTGGFGNKAEYGIPNVQMLDGPAGIHTNELTTAWPVATLLACTWNPDLLERIGAATAEEGLAVGADIWLAPALNIHRNILCGRNFEYYSEDPLVSGKMAAAITRGAQENGLGVSVKHFAANNKESNRNNIDSRISERALREIYLKGFEITVKEAQPWTIMSSYNFINGKEASERYDLLTTILREEWGYDGLVMTDWGNDSFFWREIKAGNSLKCPSGNPQDLLDACEEGLLTREELEQSVVHVLEAIMKTQTFKERAVSPSYLPVGAYGTTRIEAVDYVWLSSGAVPEACSDPESWQDLGSLNDGEWVSYNLDVAAAGTYEAAVRVAAFGGGAFDIYLDGQKVGAFQNTANTGDWQAWQTVDDAFALELPAGRHELRLEITQSGMNLQWLALTSSLSAYKVSGTIQAGDTGLTDLSGIQVGIYSKADTELTAPLDTAVTDAAGAFSFASPLPDGEYILSIQGAEGVYKPLTFPLTVNGADVHDLALLLEKDEADVTTMKGDLTGDGKVAIEDVMAACRILARNNTGTQPSGDEIARGDLTGDKKITIEDIMAICRILARQNV